MVSHALVMALILLGAIAQSQAPLAEPAAVTAEDLAVIDAALDHKTRNALNTARPRGTVLMLDRTLGPCANDRGGVRCFGYGEKTATYVQRKIREVTKARMDALFARNALPRLLPSAPAKDVILVARENLSAAMKQYDANVLASTSLPAYFDDGTALIFLESSCGPRCGQGYFLLLQRGAKGWKVRKSAMTWIS